MILAKLNWTSISTVTAPVNNAARRSGVSTSRVDAMLRSMNKSMTAIPAKASENAMMNASTTASPASRLMIGAPVACGASSCTALTNRLSA